ncbi:MAG TPA: cyclopropane-fatty-acyl-phospholipid synthase family protein [Gemmataceae bacterium]|nr:cyclopropane-fatty-acyl-phospholipid synthase family protein [Gemmataceae bacterium]
MEYRQDGAHELNGDSKVQTLDIPKVGRQPDRPEARGGEKVTALDRWLVRKILETGGNPPIGVVVWDGEELRPPSPHAVGRVRLRDRRTLWKILANPDLGFGDAYTAGRIDIEGNLVEILETLYRATAAAAPAGLLKRQLVRWLSRPRSNSLRGSRENIHHHYDIGNDFYKLWLDDQLIYTCAYFPTRNASLEQAQIAKMDHVCRKVQLNPGQRVVEAGCGWGALALHMARHYGVKVRAFNISHEQIALARQRAKAMGLDGQVEFVEDDYRNIRGEYDVFVSVGMLEHVGVEHYHQLGTIARRCLKPAGLGLIHSIGKNRQSPMNPWLETRIFPGSYLPTLREMMNVFEPNGFSVLDVENLRLHYAKTLEHWLERFERVADRVEAMFDQDFVRAWRLYLAGSLAGFTTGSIQLFQVVFAHAANNAIPWTRAALYTAESRR